MTGSSPRRRIVLGITGSSGMAYARRFLEKAPASLEIHAVMSPTAATVLFEECGLRLDPERPDFSLLAPNATAKIIPHAASSFASPIASGSFLHEGLVILPAAMSSLGAMAAGYNRHLVHRAAEVCLKEHRPLILGFREMPLSAIHLENLSRLTAAGAIALPLSPPFYLKPQKIEDLLDAVLQRIFDLLKVEVRLTHSYGE